MSEKTRLEIIAAIKEVTANLGHAPSQTELKNATGLMPWHISKAFGTYGRALKACELERTGSGYTVDRRTMFVAWAETVRRLGKVPTAYEYQENSNCHPRTLTKCAERGREFQTAFWSTCETNSWKESGKT